MIYTTDVVGKVTVDGFHHWPAAPDDLAFLRARHRHQFVVRAYVRVSDGDRQVEFIALAHQVRQVLRDRFAADAATGALEFGTHSCEQLAAWLCARLRLDGCSVYEDDENGALVTVDRPHAAQEA